jgi:uncharacterized OsmC-like protein
MDKVIVQQNRDFQIKVWAQGEGEEEPRQVAHIHELSPYTMMLGSLALCTSVVLHSYAQHHNVKLETAEITATYHRKDDEASGSGDFEEWIEESIELEGPLSDSDHARLIRVGHQCSIRKMLKSGIEIRASE